MKDDKNSESVERQVKTSLICCGKIEQFNGSFQDALSSFSLLVNKDNKPLSTIKVHTNKGIVAYCGDGTVSIGCKLHSIDHWIEYNKKIAEEHIDYTEYREEILWYLLEIKSFFEGI